MIDSDYKINPFPANFLQWVDEVYKNHDNLTFITPTKRAEWGEWSTFLSQLHALSSKISRKLPVHFIRGCLCDLRSLEQSTSEAVATWKAQQFPATRLLSLTGGLGVDDWAWAITGTAVVSLDPNGQLNQWVEWNASKLGINIQRITQTAEAFLFDLQGDASLDAVTEESEFLYDLVYVDPDRRAKGTRTAMDATEYAPNVFALIAEYPRLAKSWLVKVSPMVDPTWLQRQFPCRTEIYAVGLNGETKEILAHIHPGEPAIEGGWDAFCLMSRRDAAGQTTINSYRFWDTEVNETALGNENAETYVFEPSSPLFAAHLHTQIPQRFGILAATPNHNFFVAQAPIAAAFGRSLKVKVTFTGSLREIQRSLKEFLPAPKHKKALPQLNVTARNCGMTTDAVKKILQVADGGTDYLFIAKTDQGFTAWLGAMVR